MNRYAAKVENGTVVEVLVVADDATVATLGLVEQDGVRPSIGWSWDGSVFAPPPPPPATWDSVRAERDRLLAASDWTQVADAPLADAQKYAWAAYRQTLRNIPQDYATPDEVVWPTPPA